MRLVNFLEDEGFNELRRKMGAEQLGTFELFDPSRQLSYEEREALEEQGMAVSGHDLRVLKDKTLAFKNSRVWLKQQDYHLAQCHTVQQARLHQGEVLLGTYQWRFSSQHNVCLECLAILQYQGIDTRRLRRTEFSEQISEQFLLAEFKQLYPFYPLVI